MDSLNLLLLSVLLPIVLFFTHNLFKPRRTRRVLPPGPRPLPIIGNLLSLGPLPHRDLPALFKQYGPIICLRLGKDPTFFITSPSLAKEVLKDNDLFFPGRPLPDSTELMSYGFKRFSVADYGPYWRDARKLCISHLLGPNALHYHSQLRKQELALLVASLKEAAESGASVDLTEKVDSFNTDVLCRMVIGHKFGEIEEGARYRENVMEVSKIYGSFNISDYLPILRFLDPQGFRKRLSAVMETNDIIIERMINKHTRNRTKKEGEKYLVDILFDYMENQEEFQIGRDHIKAIIMDLFDSGLESSSVVIDWALTELLRHPTVMRKLQEELESVVGLHRPVEESDLSKLTYLQMVVKETLRIHPLGPFVDRRAEEDCTIGGFDIPKKSNVIVSLWSIFLDPEVWPEPDKFRPERFENSSIDVKGHHFELIAFSAGRRICPGMNFGLHIVSLVLAQLVHCFDWELPDGKLASDLNMMEKYVVTMPRATHLIATPTYRLRGDVRDRTS